MYDICWMKKAQIIRNVSQTLFCKVYEVPPNSKPYKIRQFFKGVKRRSLYRFLFTLFLELSMFTNKMWSSLINLEI